jgi:hypothetical protein
MDRASRWAVIIVLLAAWLPGCERAEDPAVLQQRQQLLLADEPDGAVGVIEARHHATEQPQPIVLLGRVGAGGDGTWDPKRAAFVVADTTATVEELAHAHAEHHDNCPFCKEKATTGPQLTAIIQLVDEAGDVIPIDARRLLALKEQQLVVVRGVGQIDALGNLVVTADGIYARN